MKRIKVSKGNSFRITQISKKTYIFKTAFSPLHMRFVVPITSQSLRASLHDIRSLAERDANDPKNTYIPELRLDMMSSGDLPSFEDLKLLLDTTPLPKMVTLRAKDEGGRYDGSDAKKLEYLQRSIDLGVAIVDIEAAHYPKRLEPSKSSWIQVTWHYPHGMPDNFHDAYAHIAEKLPHMIKIAALAKTEDDAQNILHYIERASRVPSIPFVGIGMGEAGRQTRIEGEDYGNYYTMA